MRPAAVVAALGVAFTAACSSERVTGPLAPAGSADAKISVTGGVAGATSAVTGEAKEVKDAKKRLTATVFSALAPAWHTDSTELEDGDDLPLPIACPGQGEFSVSQTIDRAGGVLRVGRSSITVPAGALSQPVTITATLTLGAEGARVDFAPHGLKFAKAVQVVADYAGCAVPNTAALNMYYLNSAGGIEQVLPSSDDRAGHQIRMVTDHFSGYMVSTGRR